MESSFVANDQRIMRAAENYRRCLFELLKPYIGGDILEIGAGIGNMSSLILTESGERISSYCAIEPDPDCALHLADVLKTFPTPSKIVYDRFPEAISGKALFDLVFSYNVMEHIKDDDEAFRKSKELLRPGGLLFVFVPAFQSISGSMDAKLHHFRRYSKKSLKNKLDNACFQTLEMRYYNMSGFFAWFLNNKIMGISSQKPEQVALFDKFIVRFQHHIEVVIEPPFGQSLFALAKA